VKLEKLLARITRKAKEELCFSVEDFDLRDLNSHPLLKKESLQQTFGISAVEMEEVYSEAYAFYQDNNYPQAVSSFQRLVWLNPYTVKYWMGLGASLQLLKQYERALYAYAVWALLECENPYPHFHAFECYSASKNKEESAKALALAYKRTLGKAAFKGLQKEIEVLRECL
jgi:type III secretion system low calcium response chaperone LcrH/SycD